LITGIAACCARAASGRTAERPDKFPSPHWHPQSRFGLPELTHIGTGGIAAGTPQKSPKIKAFCDICAGLGCRIGSPALPSGNHEIP
jgi:hypothetical protein